jgi:hypothetical protein
MASLPSEYGTLSEELDLSEIRLEKPGYVELVFSLVVAWGFGDTVSTLVAASFTGDVGIEANPWIRVLLVHEPLLVVLLKSAVVLYAGVVLLACRPVVERVPLWRAWLGGLVGVGALVALVNVVVGLLALA